MFWGEGLLFLRAVDGPAKPIMNYRAQLIAPMENRWQRHQQVMEI
jgi:hypothetical protein